MIPTSKECGLKPQNWVITCATEIYTPNGMSHEITINLEKASVKMRHLGVQYNPMRFHSIILSFTRPSAAVLVFSAGKIVCTGAKTFKKAVFLINKMIGLLKRHVLPRIRVKNDSLLIENVVGSARLPGCVGINVPALYKSTKQYCNYDPSIFPGIPFKKHSGDSTAAKVLPPLSGDKKKKTRTVLVFSTGKLVITGAKSKKELYETLDECLPDIWEARIEG
jgi:transcription initiation factor TFIID TATA-box-binding protein